MRQRIYVAGPYTARTEGELGANVNRAIDAGLRILKQGHIPFIPHLTHFVDLRAIETGIPMSWDDYIEWDREWLLACDSVLRLGSSRGADLECNWAMEHGMRVYNSLDEIPAPDYDGESFAPTVPERSEPRI